MENYINKQDSIFVAGHNGMVGQAIIRELKKSNDRLKQENEKYLGRGIERYVVKKTTLS